MEELPIETLNWKWDPEKLKLWEITYTKCGEWRAVKVPGGVIYTQYRLRADFDDGWEPFFSVLA